MNMNKVNLAEMVSKMSQEDIELLLSVLDVELKERYYAENPEKTGAEPGKYGVYMPMDEFESIKSPSEYSH